MKKSTSKKSSLPAAPQVKSAVKKTAAPAAKKSAPAAPVAAAPEKEPAPKKVVPKKSAGRKQPAASLPTEVPAVTPEPLAPPPVQTTIVATIDIGFGNTLFIRGEGPGLTWNSGLAMYPEAADRWVINLTGGDRPLVFKFLVNDLTWSAGNDYVIEPGAHVVLAPTF